MNNKPNFLGRHILAEFYECNPNILNNVEIIEQLMEKAAIACGASVVQKCFHVFNPYGVSGVIVIAESHLAIHTWPELGYAAVDIFTCGDTVDPKIAYECLKFDFSAQNSNYTELKRGEFDKKLNGVVQSPFIVAEQ